MKGVFFKPWVGKKYFENGVDGLKILVLGDSHYCNAVDEDCDGCDSHKTCFSLTFFLRKKREENIIFH
jgi:hypothetical protein